MSINKSLVKHIMMIYTMEILCSYLKEWGGYTCTNMEEFQRIALREKSKCG